MYTQVEGYNGENRVAEHLMRDGFTIIARNYAINAGEIDIIARKGMLTIFVEVKTRTTSAYFDLTEVITPSKQRKIIRTARYWIANHSEHAMDYRFDVALIEQEDISYIPDAFHAQDI